MKQQIQIVSIKFPAKGNHIDRGIYNYETTSLDEPAFAFKWSGKLFRGPKATFVFPKDVVKIFKISDETTEKLTKAYAAEIMRNSSGSGGILVSMAFGAIGSAMTKTTNMKGFVVCYNNTSGHLALFAACAPPLIVDSIFTAVPKDRILEPDATPPDIE